MKNNADQFIREKYEHGFVTDIEQDTFEPGLDEEVIKKLSQIKKEPFHKRSKRF